MSWQRVALCTDCWLRSPESQNGTRTPHRLVNLPFDELLETCNVCNRATCSGIYVRRDVDAVSPMLTRDNMALDVWTVYDHPTDWPDYFVARRFEVDQPTGSLILNKALSELQQDLASRGLVRLERQPADDPVILETWL
jgi:hypothetical protein